MVDLLNGKIRVGPFYGQFNRTLEEAMGNATESFKQVELENKAFLEKDNRTQEQVDALAALLADVGDADEAIV